MPHNAIQIMPGVDTTKTQTLNQAGISQSNFVRFLPDRPSQYVGVQGSSIVQKLGGWIQWFSGTISSVARALWAWEDLNLYKWLGVGTTTGLYAYQYGVSNALTTESGNIITTEAGTPLYPSYGLQDNPSTQSFNITPETITTMPLPNFTAQSGVLLTENGNALTTEALTPSYPSYNFQVASGSTTVTVVDPGFSVRVGDYVNYLTQVSVGGGTIQGLYPIASVIDTQTYTINIPYYPTSETVNGGSLPFFSTATNSGTVTVVYPNHGFSIGSTVSFNVPTVVGGITIYGYYTVATVIDVNTYTFIAAVQATSTQSSFMNFGNMDDVYYVNIGPPGANTGYGLGGYGYGGYGVGQPVNTGRNTTASFTGSIDGSGILTASSVTGNIVPGMTLSGSGVASGTTIQSQITGTPYGAGTYQVSTIAAVSSTSMTATNSPTTITATDWSLDNFGQLLVAAPRGGPIFYYTPEGPSATAFIFNNSPTVNNGMFVAMPQRQIIAYGSSFTGIIDPLLIRWCDVGDPTTWIATSVNQAGSYRLPEGSQIVAGLQTQQQAIFWTDESVWSMQYIGSPLVYAFNKIATGVGAIGPKAVGAMNNMVFWMSPSQFNMLSPQGVTAIPCPVWDVVFQNLNSAYVYNIRCATNSLFSEVWWFYPSTASTSGENDSYVKYNVSTMTWDYGSMGRTAWIDQSVLGPPIGTGTDLVIYQHEVGNDAGLVPMTPSFETGYFALSEGDQMVFIDQMWPDMKWGDYNQNQTGQANASVQITFFGVNYPGDTPTQYGPYTVTKSTEYISTRIRNRLLAFQVSSSDANSFWRLGQIRYRFQPDGKY